MVVAIIAVLDSVVEEWTDSDRKHRAFTKSAERYIDQRMGFGLF